MKPAPWQSMSILSLALGYLMKYERVGECLMLDYTVLAGTQSQGRAWDSLKFVQRTATNMVDTATKL